MLKNEILLPLYRLRHFSFKGKNWEYIVTGDGTPLVILPGGGETAETNFRLIRALEKSNRIIIPTIYNVDSISDFNSALNAILQHEHVGKFILYGLSIGGLLAQTYTRDNSHRVEALILSHACTPLSRIYKKRIVNPLKVAKIFLPFTSYSLIKIVSRFAAKIQGSSNNIGTKYPITINSKDQAYWQMLMRDYHKKFFNKRLIQTWINLHLDFAQQVLQAKEFAFLKNHVMIMRTDNDPLMQDEGDFMRLYPLAEVHTFQDTGHLTTHYQLESIAKVMKKFLMKVS